MAMFNRYVSLPKCTDLANEKGVEAPESWNFPDPQLAQVPARYCCAGVGTNHPERPPTQRSLAAWNLDFGRCQRKHMGKKGCFRTYQELYG